MRLPPIVEHARHASPVRGPQGLAWDGSTMWVTSAANGRVYAIDPRDWSVTAEFVPPFESLGIAYAGSDFRVVLAPAIDEPDLELDRRYVYAFAPDAGFSERFVCPDASGSMLAFDRGTLYLSQAWQKRLVELDARGAAVRDWTLDRRPVGLTIVGGAFYLATVDDDWHDGRIERLPIDDDGSAMRALGSLPFAPRGVAFDGEFFWTADRNGHAIASFAIAGVAT